MPPWALSRYGVPPSAGGALMRHLPFPPGAVYGFDAIVQPPSSFNLIVVSSAHSQVIHARAAQFSVGFPQRIIPAAGAAFTTPLYFTYKVICQNEQTYAQSGQGSVNYTIGGVDQPPINGPIFNVPPQSTAQVIYTGTVPVNAQYLTFTLTANSANGLAPGTEAYFYGL